MKMVGLTGLLTIAGISAAVAAPPNVVLIVADDLGYSDAGFTMDYAMAMRTSDYLGQPWDTNALAEVHTPNIDRLADQGVVFTSGYVNGSVCSPTRAGLMLGRYQQRVNIYGPGNGGYGMAVYEEKEKSQSGTDYARINPMFPEFLKQSVAIESNYVAGAFGKWHLGIDEIYENKNGSINGDRSVYDSRVNKTAFSYSSIGGNFEEPAAPDPILNVGAGDSYDPGWVGGSPWHSLNRRFDEAFFFMGRGGHDYWNPNEIYDTYDPAHPQRRTVGLNTRRNPGYSGADDDGDTPTDSWDNASTYEIHNERVPTNYLTPRITQAACDFIGRHATNSQPFFAYVPFNAAHSPSQVPYHFDPATGDLDRLGTDARRYNVLDGSGSPVSNITADVVADWYNPKTPDPNWFPDPLYIYEQFKDNTNAFRYFSGGSGQSAVKNDGDIRNRCVTLAMIRWMDKGIGQIMQKLRDPNGDGDESDSVYENTIVLFISDNGGASGMNAANAPLQGNKSTLWEGGVRSPFVFSWPSMLKAQNGTQTNDLGEVVANPQMIDAPVMAFDFLPTLLDINGLDPLDPDPLLSAERQAFYDYTPDGKSLMPLIRGEAAAIHDYLFWAREHGATAEGAVRKGEWKLRLSDDGAETLYNLNDDIAETTDLSGSHPDVVRELRQAYFDFMNSASASEGRPVPNGYLYTTLSSPPAAPGTAATEEFEYAGAAITNGANGGHNWNGAWQTSSDTEGRLLAGSLLFNDPSTNYVDGDAGSFIGTDRSGIQMSRSFNSTDVATPVWVSCLVENMDDGGYTNLANHTDIQHWKLRPNNDSDTYLRIGDGFTEVSRFVANGVSQPLDVPIDLDAALTYLVVMRMETDVSGINDSVKAWIIPEGTAIGGYTEAELDTAAGGAPNLDKSDADLWSGGLSSMGFEGDAYQNQEHAYARIDGIRISFAGTNETDRIQSLFSPSIEGGGDFDISEAVAIQSYTVQGTDPVSFTFEYDETAGWLSDDASSGVQFEKATSLVSNDWTVISPTDITMLDWWGDRKSYQSTFDLTGGTNGFIRVRNP